MAFVNHIETNPHTRIAPQYIWLNSGLWSNLMRETVITTTLFSSRRRECIFKKIGKCKQHGPLSWYKLFVTLLVIFIRKRLLSQVIGFKNAILFKMLKKIYFAPFSPHYYFLKYFSKILQFTFPYSQPSLLNILRNSEHGIKNIRQSW